MRSLLCALGIHEYGRWERFEKTSVVYLRAYMFGPVDLERPIRLTETWQRRVCRRCGRTQEEGIDP